MSFLRYPRYKDSGVEWLGDVPEHWTIDRLKRSTLGAKNGIWGDDPKGDENDLSCVRVADFDRQKLVVNLSDPTIRNVTQKEQVGRVVQPGDLLLEKSGGGENQPVGCVVLYDHAQAAVCSNFVARVVVAPEMSAMFWRYYHAALYSLRINTRSIKQTSGIQNLDQQQYFDEAAVFPPASEQMRIANFLDRETGKLDSLITEQHRLIELLKEKRQALITHAVTRGLDPDAPMKPSGVEWLGDLPAHWTIDRLKNSISRVEQGWSPQCESYPADETQWGVLKVGCVNNPEFDASEQKALPSSEDSISYLQVRPGDILVSRGNTLELVGSAALVRDVRPKLMISDLLYRFRALERANAEFLVLGLRSMYVRYQIERNASGTSPSMKKISQATLRSLLICLPPMEEQQRIVEFIASEMDRIDELAAEAESAIALLQERRIALISAAVTGKIDVRNLVEAA
jgi:type I restriction enzyme S subunit